MTQQMRDLYQAGKELGQLKWWEFCDPYEPILIKNPQNGEIGYCVLIDQAVNVYLGDKGLLSYLDLFDIEEEESGEAEGFKVFYRQEMVRVSFDDREDIDDEEYERIKSSGVSFHGEAQWPAIRRFEAGFVPYFIENQEEIQFMTHVIEQLVVILKAIKKEEISLEDDQLLLASIQDGNWKLDHVDSEEVLEKDIPSPFAFSYRNDLKVHRIKKLPMADVTFEGVQYMMPEPFFDEGTNHLAFPVITAFIDSQTAFAHLNDFSDHNELNKVTDKFADMLLNDLKYRPKEIIVEDLALLEMIEDFCEQIEVECYVGYTPAADFFVETMISFSDSNRLGETFEDDADFDFDEFDFEDDDDFDLDEFDFEDELAPQALMDNILKMGHEIYSIMVELPELRKLPEIQKQSILEVFIYSLVHMGLEYGEGMPYWSETSFEDFMDSRIIEEELESQYIKYIYPSMIKFLECAGSMDLLKNTDDLIKIVHKYYRQ